jgi:leucyl-tRNA synthetase
MLFLGPPPAQFEWPTGDKKDDGIEAAWRFLSRVWRAVDGVAERLASPSSSAAASSGDATRALRVKTHKTIKQVTDDLEQRLQPNTAIARLMELCSKLTEYLAGGDFDGAAAREAAEALCLLIGPVTPHLAEELWERLGHAGADRVLDHAWPGFDAALLEGQKIPIAVQVNGKLRGTLEVDPDTTDDDLQSQALALPGVAAQLAGKAIKRSVVVKGRLLNLVV